MKLFDEPIAVPLGISALVAAWPPHSDFEATEPASTGQAETDCGHECSHGGSRPVGEDKPAASNVNRASQAPRSGLACPVVNPERGISQWRIRAGAFKYQDCGTGQG